MFKKKIIIMFNDEFVGNLIDVRQNIISDNLDNTIKFLKRYFDKILISNNGNFLDCYSDNELYTADIKICYELEE